MTITPNLYFKNSKNKDQNHKMVNILAITPVSIAGTLIINGLIKGFEQCGNNILSFDVRELDNNIIKKFNPDFVIGYDYVHFINSQAEKIVTDLNIPVIHYFADDPNSDFAHSGDLELYKKFSYSNGIVFCWDRQLLGSFANKAYYMPLGVDPELYNINCDYEKNIDISFVGRPLTARRITLLSDIIKIYPEKLKIFSYKKHFDKSVEEIRKAGLLDFSQLKQYENCYAGFLKTEKELAEIYKGAKIVLNITMDQGLSSMNYRVLEVLGSEGFLLTDFKKDTAEYFKDRKIWFFIMKKILMKKF